MGVNTFYQVSSMRSMKDFHELKKITDFPDKCPLCHKHIEPNLWLIAQNQNDYMEDLELIFSCPAKGCSHIFIGIYKYSGSPSMKYIYSFDHCKPINSIPRMFDEEIQELSGLFCEIYDQSKAAEEQGLNQICGMGYRKALEYLIKDYIISLDESKETTIKKKPLAQCIKEDISYENIKACAQRATWLGNDETHYVRKWLDKDITDLKILIDLTIFWISGEIATAKYINEMSQ